MGSFSAIDFNRCFQDSIGPNEKCKRGERGGKSERVDSAVRQPRGHLARRRHVDNSARLIGWPSGRQYK